MDEDKKEVVPEKVETVNCPNCKKIIYNNELCSCQKKAIPSWMPDIRKEIPLKDRHY